MLEPESATRGGLQTLRAVAAVFVLVSAVLVGSAIGAAHTGVDPASDDVPAMERQSSNATLSLAVEERTDDRLTVTLSTDAANVAGYGANVTFDPAVLSVESVTGVDLSDPVTNGDDRAGWVFLTQSQARGVGQPELARITFTIRESRETSLSFVDGASTLNDGQVPPEPIPFETQGITISPGASGDGSAGVGGKDGAGDGPGAGQTSGEMHFAIIPVLILVPTLAAVCVLFVAAMIFRRVT